MIPLFRWIYSKAWLSRAVYLIVGLSVCQLMAYGHMAHVNASLVSRSLDASRTLSPFVPGIQVLHDALDFGTLFSAALFLTATIGSAATLLTLFGIELVRLPGTGTRIVFFLFGFAWISLLLALNIQGFNLFPTACLIVVPLVLGLIDRSLSRPGLKSPLPRSSALSRVAPLIIILVWTLPVGLSGFSAFRDRVLLPTAVGQSLIRFYYGNAYYPASSMQSFRQKRMKTWAAGSPFADKALQDRVESILSARSNIPVSDPLYADLLIRQDGGNLELSVPGRTVLTLSASEFFGDPDAVLRRFSDHSDCFAGLRLFTFLSLLTTFPIAGCLLLYSGLRLAAGLLLPDGRAGIASAVILMVLGVAVALPLIPDKAPVLSPAEVGKWLTSADISRRRAAYRYLSTRADIGRYFDANLSLKTREVADRYWLSRLLSQSRRHLDVLTGLTRDPVPSIGCSAIRSLGRLHSPPARRRIRTILDTTRSWYLQDCAFQSFHRGK